jgi:hypothetical protein
MLVPSALGIIVGRPPIRTAAAELLVPRSIPIIFDKISSPELSKCYYSVNI